MLFYGVYAIEDASGRQEFSYGRMGEVVKNIRTFALPNEQNTYTFAMSFKYDSWNRILSTNYPDGEHVRYWKGYTKHYYAGSERVIGVLFDAHEFRLDKLYFYKNAESGKMDRYFYHPDHLGSSSWITDNTGRPIQHLHYLPFGEDWVDQRNSSWNAPYTFSGKEKDVETGYGYFGARYYDSGLSIWLSVDPMSDKYPSMSPYNYCANNPVILVDPDGREIGDYFDIFGVKIGWDGKDDGKQYVVADQSEATTVMQNGIAGQITENVESAMELPSLSNREAMFKHVSDGDKNNPNAESGGVWGLKADSSIPMSDWSQEIRLAAQGPTGNPCNKDEILTIDYNTADLNWFKPLGTFHAHGSGVCERDGLGWEQNPHQVDLLNAISNARNKGMTGTNFVFAMRDKNVHLYNSKGYQTTISFSTFLNLGK